MAFTYAYSLGGGMSTIVDYPLETVANYKNGVTRTNGVTKGDPVLLVSGLLKAGKDGATATVKILGVLEGVEFKGLADGGTYAASSASFGSHVLDATNFPNGVGKVRIDNDAVYKLPTKATQTLANANVGVSYGIFQDTTTGDYQMDTGSTTTNVLVTVVGVAYAGTGAAGNQAIAYVVLKGNPIV